MTVLELVQNPHPLTVLCWARRSLYIIIYIIYNKVGKLKIKGRAVAGNLDTRARNVRGSNKIGSHLARENDPL